MESDSSVTVQLINVGCGPLHPYGPLVNQIRAWKEKAWEFHCVYVFWEANQVADCLTNMTHDLGSENHVMERLPPRVSNMLLFDVSGVSFPRSTCV